TSVSTPPRTPGWPQTRSRGWSCAPVDPRAREKGARTGCARHPTGPKNTRNVCCSGSPALLAVSRVLLAVTVLLTVTGVVLLVVAGVRLLITLVVALVLVTGVGVLRLGSGGLLGVGLRLPRPVLCGSLFGGLAVFLVLVPVRVGPEDEQTRGRALTRLARGDQVQVPSCFLDAFED